MRNKISDVDVFKAWTSDDKEVFANLCTEYENWSYELNQIAKKGTDSKEEFDRINSLRGAVDMAINICKAKVL